MIVLSQLHTARFLEQPKNVAIIMVVNFVSSGGRGGGLFGG